MASWSRPPERLAGEWVCFRQTSPRWPALMHEAGAAHPMQESGRWHREGEGYAQYLSLSAAGAWAELLRYLSIHTPELAVEQRRHLWAVRVAETQIADLGDFASWSAAGLDPGVAVGEHSRSQTLARELLDAGYRGLLAPSAALPGAVNLTLFGERYEWSPLLGPAPDPQLWLAVELAAPDAHPPPDLLETTRYQGQEHAGLRAYLTGLRGGS